jgi:hypothetical protein
MNCVEDNILDIYIDIEDRNDCVNLGGEWVNKDSNFDNVANSMITLFEMATTEGWIDVM